MHVHGTHQPTGAYLCDTCPGLEPWPCAPARARLRTEYAGCPTTLAVHMRRHLAAACQVAPDDESPRRLWERVVGWCVPRPAEVGYAANRAATGRWGPRAGHA